MLVGVWGALTSVGGCVRGTNMEYSSSGYSSSYM